MSKVHKESNKKIKNDSNVTTALRQKLFGR